jgi:hypothetical protein
MGQLFNQVLGIPSGKVGTLIFRRRKGANFIAVPPATRTKAPNADEIALRAKFGLAVKIASKINSVEVLKACWPSNSGRGSKCNEIMKANYDLINSAENLGTVAVAPLFGFNTVNAVLTAEAAGIHLVTDALGIGLDIDTGIEKYIVAAGIVVLQNPTLEHLPAIQVLPFKSLQHNLELINPVDMTVDFSGGSLTMFQGYADKKVFACLVTLDDDGKSIKFSSTVHS